MWWRAWSVASWQQPTPGLCHRTRSCSTCAAFPRHGGAGCNLQAPQGRSARHFGPDRRRPHGTAAAYRRRRPARPRRDPGGGTPHHRRTIRARRSRPGSASCRKSASATASSPAARSARTWARLHEAVLALRLRAPAGPRRREREVDARDGPSPADVERPIGQFRAATSRRPSSAAGSRPAPASCCSTSPRVASTWAPRPRSTR